MSYKIVVMSCDKNEDLWLPFHLCIEKYWKDHPEIIYSTETKVNPYYRTICRNYPIEKWTIRAKETIECLPCRNILLMVDDIFIREKVDNDFIWSLQKQIVGNVAAINFEFSFDKEDIRYLPNILIRNTKGRFKLSCMCQMWKKKYMLKLFAKPYDAWTFEKKNEHLGYCYLISKNGDFINWGKQRDNWKWGLVRGKWTHECKEFFDKEGIEIDYSIRGFCD